MTMKVELIGDGASKTHNATRTFSKLKPRAPTGNTCNWCGILVPKRRRYCDACRDRKRGKCAKNEVNCGTTPIIEPETGMKISKSNESEDRMISPVVKVRFPGEPRSFDPESLPNVKATATNWQRRIYGDGTSED